MNRSIVLQEDNLKSLALAVARNRVGPDDPIEDVLARECVSPAEFSKIMDDPIFQRYVKTYVTELRESGFSFASKCRILAEDSIESVYQITKDPDQPAAARIKATEMLVEWGKLHTPTPHEADTGPKFQIVFNVPQGFGAGSSPSIEVHQQTTPTHAAIEADFDVVFDPEATPPLSEALSAA